MAACLFSHQEDWSIDIPETEDVDGVMVYKIKMRIGTVNWEVKHRYKEFAELHAALSSDHGISKGSFPPKRLLNNKDPDFVEKRRSELETYLTNTFSLLIKTLPEQLANFLNFHEFDVIILLKKLTTEFLNRGFLRTPPTEYEFNIMQIHAISKRLRLPCPPGDMIGLQHDFCSILDVCNCLQKVKVVGNDKIISTSNINQDKLLFELTPFKSIVKLVLKGVSPENIVKAEDLRRKLKYLAVVHCGIKYIRDILMCDTLHRSAQHSGDTYQWINLTDADFSFNKIKHFGTSLLLLPKITHLNLSNNKINDLTKISDLRNLHRLNLASNNISNIECLKGKLKNLAFLDLSQNQLVSLNGLQELLCLQGANFACNSIADLEELAYVKHLPKLAYIVLIGNPISTIVDYRVKVLEKFDHRAHKVCLDNEQSTEQELDTVAVLQTLRFVKEGKSPDFHVCSTSVYQT